MARRPSACHSLQSTLIKDSESSSHKPQTPRHGTWRDSVSGIARSVLLRAKGSIDHMRGAPEQDEQYVPLSCRTRATIDTA